MILQVGDLIEGLDGANDAYTYSRKGGVYKIVGVREEDTIEIVALEPSPFSHNEKLRGPWLVEAEHFQLINVSLINE